MILIAIFLAAVVLIAAGHLARTVKRATARAADRVVEATDTLTRAITAQANIDAFDRMGRTR